MCWSVFWLSFRKLNHFYVYNKSDFLSSCFSSTNLFKISDKIFWKSHESQDGCPNGCQDPMFCGPKDRLCFGAQTQEHKPEPWSLQAITGYKTMLKSRLQSASVASKNTLSVGREAKAKQTWGSYWHQWSWLWPWQCTAAVRKVRKGTSSLKTLGGCTIVVNQRDLGIDSLICYWVLSSIGQKHKHFHLWTAAENSNILTYWSVKPVWQLGELAKACWVFNFGSSGWVAGQSCVKNRRLYSCQHWSVVKSQRYALSQVFTCWKMWNGKNSGGEKKHQLIFRKRKGVVPLNKSISHLKRI